MKHKLSVSRIGYASHAWLYHGVVSLSSADAVRLCHECGFELAGVAAALPVSDAQDYLHWASRGLAGAMGYLTDRRAGLRQDPRNLLPSARSIVCVARLYNTPHPSTANEYAGWISRYAWGEDYHGVLRRDLERLAVRMAEAAGPFEHKICVDTAPLLERSYARLAGLGWIGKNTCLIHEGAGSWFFLGELITSLDLVPSEPPPDRCGTCTRCIDACPTQALVPLTSTRCELDATRCISYFTIELRGAVDEAFRPAAGHHLFGCDICQDVCPWNRLAPLTEDASFAPRHFAPPLAEMAALGEAEFLALFQGTPVTRARYSGFLRNVAIAMGNAGKQEFRAPLEKMAASPDPIVSEHARWALAQLPLEATPVEERR